MPRYRVETQFGTEEIEGDGTTTTDGVLTIWKLTGRPPTPGAMQEQHHAVIKYYSPYYWKTLIQVSEV